MKKETQEENNEPKKIDERELEALIKQMALKHAIASINSIKRELGIDEKEQAKRKNLTNPPKKNKGEKNG